MLASNGAAVADACLTIENRRLRKGLPPPNIATTKDFLRFIVATSRGRIDDKHNKITVKSLIANAEWFFAGFARVTGNGAKEEDRQEIYWVSTDSKPIRRRADSNLQQWVKNTLTAEGLVINKEKPKFYSPIETLPNSLSRSGLLTTANLLIPGTKFKSPSL